MEEVAIEVMKIGNPIELLQTMAIMSLNIKNLTLELNIPKKY
jgi:hypothetical protein